ncbi:MAG TPA: zf-HC2 domain-containing protein [Terriglobia bacterium]|nr:zf-HC2 domain-containing protein [Terriglobia bacterium]
MDHFSELIYSMYADGELPEPERPRVQQHLAQCAACRAQLAALEVENRVLAEVFRMTAEPESARARVGIGRSLLITVASALAVALGLDRLLAAITYFVPDLGSWMRGFSFGWLQNLIFSNAFDLIREGPVMLNALVTVLGLLVLGAILFGVLRHFTSRHPMSMALLATLLLGVIVPRPASALERRQATRLRVAPDETVRESLIAQGDVVEIDGTVDGSVAITARLAVVRGDIKGNLFAFAQETQVLGTVEGSVYAWTNTLTVSGHVNQDIVVGANNLHLEGTVGRDVTSFTGTADDSGTVGRNLQAYVGSLTVSKSARIGGNLEAHVHHAQDVNVESGAAVAGKTQVLIEKKEPNRYATAHFYYWRAIWLAGAFILGLLLYLLAPGLFSRRLDTGSTLGWSFLIGLGVFFATPFAAVLACFTLVGIPAAVVALVLWLISWIFLAKVFVGAALGRSLLRGRPVEAPFALALLIGLIIVSIAVNLPYVGFWLGVLVVMVGLGLLASGVRSGTKKPVATL